MRTITLCLFILSALVLSSVQAQHKNVFALAQGPFQEAEIHYNQGDYQSAIELYEKALLKDRRRKGVIALRLANSYRLLHNNKKAEFWYKGIMNNKSLISKADVLSYAQILLSNKKYEASKAWFEHYNKEYGVDSLVIRKLYGIEHMTSFYKDSLSHPVTPLSINTSYSEFSPVFYSNGMVFTSSREPEGVVKTINTKDSKAFLDLHYSAFNANKVLQSPRLFQHSLRHSFHDGPIVFYAEGNKAIVTRNFDFKEQNRSDRSKRHLGLFLIEKSADGQWNEGSSFPFNNTDYSVAHAAVNSTGETVYFSSDMPGGLGGTDLYVSHYRNGNWSNPHNLGPTVNTSGNELFPYLFKDSLLYFSSTGFAGLGGLDIYKTHACGSDLFCQPENLGYPMNSSQDDFGIVFSEDHRSGYLSSNRRHGGSDDDLFFFEVTTVFLKGNIKSKLKNTPLANVRVTATQKEKEIASTTTDEKGNYLFSLDSKQDYTLSFSKENYKGISNDISTRYRSNTDTLLQDLVMEKEVKTLVNGVVKQNDRLMADIKIIALETKTRKQDTLKTDERGEFYMEADPEQEYYFYADTKYSFGEVLLESSKKTKGTFLLYMNIELHTYDTTFVNVLVQDSYHLPAANALVSIENTKTGKRDSMYTNKKGMIRFVAKSYADYRISSHHKGKYASLDDFNLLTNRVRKLVLVLKEEEEGK